MTQFIHIISRKAIFPSLFNSQNYIYFAIIAAQLIRTLKLSTNSCVRKCRNIYVIELACQKSAHVISPIRTSLILDIYVMINWHLSKQGIRWPISRDHIAGSSIQLVEVTYWPLANFWFLIGSRAQVRLTCWKQGRVVWKPVNASPGLKFIQIITFSSIQMCFAIMKLKLQKAKQ